MQEAALCAERPSRQITVLRPWTRNTVATAAPIAPGRSTPILCQVIAALLAAPGPWHRCSARHARPLRPALLRCYQIAFPIHEEFGCCNMRTFGVFRPLWARFLRSTGTFTQGAQANLPGQREQGLSHRSETHAAKDSPFMLRNGDHHPCIGGGEFVRHIVERDVVLNDGFTMNASQSRQHYRHHIVGNKRETKTE